MRGAAGMGWGGRVLGEELGGRCGRFGPGEERRGRMPGPAC